VEESPQGMTHQELATLLGVRAQNTLRDLVQEDRIRRERLGATFVYLSRRASIRREQVRRRKSVLAEPEKPRPTTRQVIATLLELIKDPQAGREQLVLRCQRSGVPMTRQLLDAADGSRCGSRAREKLFRHATGDSWPSSSKAIAPITLTFRRLGLRNSSASSHRAVTLLTT